MAYSTLRVRATLPCSATQLQCKALPCHYLAKNGRVFEDGNKRTSRLASNLPLLLYNCALLSFLDIEQPDYTYAMLGLYQQRSVAPAVGPITVDTQPGWWCWRYAFK